MFGSTWGLDPSGRGWLVLFGKCWKDLGGIHISSWTCERTSFNLNRGVRRGGRKGGGGLSVGLVYSTVAYTEVGEGEQDG